MTRPTNHAAAGGPRRQVTLAELLSLMLGSSTYFAMLASLPWLDGRFEAARWQIPVTVLTAWFVLWRLYRRWGLRQAVTVHFAGPAMALGLIAIGVSVGLLASIADGPPRGSIVDLLEATAILLLGGCAISSVVSLPAAIVMLAYLCTTRVPVRRKDRQEWVRAVSFTER